MALAYLLDPNLQIQSRAGANNVNGWVEVFLSDTDDHAVTYCDFNGTLNPERIVIDNDGRCVIIADDSKVYRVEVYFRDGNLLWTQYPVWCIGAGEGGAESTEIISTDGSIAVERMQIGSTTQYDLGVAKDSAEYLEWAHCSECRTPTSNVFYPVGDDGSTIFSDNTGLALTANGLYHVSFKVVVTKSAVAPYYDGVSVKLNTSDGTETTTQLSYGAVVDGSLGLSQEFEISGDIKTGSADTTRIFVTIEDTSVAGVTYSLASFDIHRVFSGVPHIPGLNLVGGTGISLTKSGNTLTIASSGGGGSVPTPGQGGYRFLGCDGNGTMQWTDGPTAYRVLTAAPDAPQIAQIVADAAQLASNGSALVIGIYNNYSGKIQWYTHTLTQLTGTATGTVGFTCCAPEYSAGSWGHVFYTATFYADADSSQNYSRFMAGFGNNVHVFDPWMNFGG